MKINIHIFDDLKDIRLDTLLCRHDKTISRSCAAALIHKNQIHVNNYPRKPGYRVKPGDVITGTIPCAPICEAMALPEDIPTEIVFEDEHIMVINKRPGMIVHPSPGNLSGTLVNALLHYNPKILGVGEQKNRSGIVHRLDKDTSGLMVIAKTMQALFFLQREFKQRRVEKRYLALVHGNLSEDQGQIYLPIGRHPVKRKLMAVDPERGKPALTLWKVQKRFKTACLVEVNLKTGRTHQIRVHFYWKDHPLVGDRVYQFRRLRKEKSIAPRQMLHSSMLSFRHPYSGRRLAFKTDLPRDFSDTLSLFESVTLTASLSMPPQP